MSETPATDAPAAGTTETPKEPLFTRDEIAQFDEDDAIAGRNIGKMLATIFLYTAFAMTFAAYWTYSNLAPGN